jgi:hypothetical protein
MTISHPGPSSAALPPALSPPVRPEPDARARALRRGLRRVTRTLAVGALAAAMGMAASPTLAQASPERSPSRATAVTGDDPASLRRFVEQRPRWTACDHKDLDETGARCATIRVPLDYRHPEGRTLTGQGLHRKMPNSRLITLKAQVHGVYALYPNRCVHQQVNDYLRTGELPARDTICEKDPADAVGR